MLLPLHAMIPSAIERGGQTFVASHRVHAAEGHIGVIFHGKANVSFRCEADQPILPCTILHSASERIRLRRPSRRGVPPPAMNGALFAVDACCVRTTAGRASALGRSSQSWRHHASAGLFFATSGNNGCSTEIGASVKSRTSDSHSVTGTSGPCSYSPRRRPPHPHASAQDHRLGCAPRGCCPPRFLSGRIRSR